jgi:glycosyltransferase involved in cell wall biosynthesis
MKKVSVVIPCRNEVGFIEQCIRNICGFDPPDGGFEVIVCDGNSDDGTRELLHSLQKEFSELRILRNPNKTVPYAMNLGITSALGEYIVRADVRCRHPRSYLIDLLTLSESTGADNVGGVLVPMGDHYVQRGIAASYKSFISMGSALRERNNFLGETDTVYGGCFKRQKLLSLGMYDEQMVRNQDDELSFRLRKNKGKIIQSSDIKIKYFPRKNLKKLAKQFVQYGYWKIFVIKRHPLQASLRHFAPFCLVSIVAFLGIYSFFSPHALLIFQLFIFSYIAAVLFEASRVSCKTEFKLLPIIATSIILVHFSFGIGFAAGIFGLLLNKSPRWFQTLSR